MTYRVDFCESGSFIMSGSNVSVLQKCNKETLVSVGKILICKIDFKVQPYHYEFTSLLGLQRNI